MLNFPGPEKIMLLAMIALVVLGPSRLPQAARTAGKWVAELRKLTSRFKEELSGSLSEPKDAITAAVGDLRHEMGGWRNEMAGLGRAATTAPVNPSQAGEPATWTNAPNGNTLFGPSTTTPSTELLGSGSSGLATPRLPVPPAPDDPSLN